MRSYTVALSAAVLAGVLGLFPNEAAAKCTRLAFSVNDYGKDGPTRDAKQFLKKYIAKWTSDRGIKRYRTSRKTVKCELFLDFGFFDEHTCRAEATVCWGGRPKTAKKKPEKKVPAKSAETVKPAEPKPELKPVQTKAPKAEKPYVYIPSTISQEAQALLRALPNPNLAPAFPDPDEIEKWKAAQQAAEAHNLEMQKALVDRLQPNVTKRDFGGVPVLDIKARGWKDNGKVLVYTHGGAYTFQSAASTLASSALVADRTGLRVVSVDYTLAPHSKWRQTIAQVITVFDELKRQGYAMADIAIYGDSAGGGMAAGVVLKMRDDGMGMPAAVVLWSPWADITETGDSYETLKQAEPMYIYEKHLKHSADAYADPKDQKNPYVSPVYGDYTKGFPPTLIQGGTKEIFLSNFIRLYQSLDLAGQTVKLDPYEGMSHVFQAFMPDTPESKTALGKVDAFLKQHLGK